MLFFILNPALSILAPKHIDKYTSSISEESARLVNGLLESTAKDGATDPAKYLELNSMNVVYSAAFGRKYESIQDPDFIELSEIIEDSMKLAGIENDLANFLPIVSIVDYFAGTQVKMKHFVKTKVEPTFRKLIREAAQREGSNLVKSLDENGLELSEGEKRVFFCRLSFNGLYVCCAFWLLIC